jgi:hypothetical protein
VVRYSGGGVAAASWGAIGMALAASNQFPDYRQILLLVVISSTVLFEIVGPIFTRVALANANSSTS